MPPAFYFYYKTQEVINHIITGQINSNLDKIYVAESISPENTGFTTLLEYILHLYSTGIQYAVFSAFNFSDLPQNNWGFNIDTVMLGGAISVKAYRQLSDSTYYFRAITFEGNWASYWKEFTLGQDIKFKEINLTYNNPNTMYAEINATEIGGGIPISLIIHKRSQTPYDSIVSANATKIDDTVKCIARSDGGFVVGHVLSTSIAYL